MSSANFNGGTLFIRRVIRGNNPKWPNLIFSNSPMRWTSKFGFSQDWLETVGFLQRVSMESDEVWQNLSNLVRKFKVLIDSDSFSNLEGKISLYHSTVYVWTWKKHHLLLARCHHLAVALSKFIKRYAATKTERIIKYSFRRMTSVVYNGLKLIHFINIIAKQSNS